MNPVLSNTFRTGNSSSGTPMTFEVIDENTFKITFDGAYGGFLAKISTSASWAGYTDTLKPAHFLKPFHKDFAEECHGSLEAYYEFMQPFASFMGYDDVSEEGVWCYVFNQMDCTNWELTDPNDAMPSYYFGDLIDCDSFPQLYPWIMTECADGKMTTWTRNPYYFCVDEAGNQMPYFDKLTSAYVESAELVQFSAMSGDVDFMRESATINNVSLYRENEEKAGIHAYTTSMHNNPGDINLNFIVQDDVVMDFVPDYVGKVMNNLLSNAIKFTPPYGKVSVNIRREGGHLLLDVADTGRGMDKETTDHVFDPFFQAEDDSANIGTGIGLALVKQIVDALGGNIGVESEPGKGSAFHIRLPIHNNIKKKMEEKTIADQPAAPHSTALPADSGGTDNDCRLLIIEDNHDVAAYIGAQLGASGRYALYYAANGREGLEKALQLVPDLIITDLMMPGMDGLEVCRQVRANDIVNHVPIIVVTAKITEEERIEGLQAGADAYLAKPFNADELRTRVEKLLESRRLMREKFASIANGGCGREPKDEAGKPCEADLRFLTKVADVVHTQLNHNRETSVAAVASMMCMSNSQFYRKMVAVTGYTPMAYIQRIRIRKAMKMMADNPHTPLSEVADRCGFDVYPNFVRAFKNVCGTTPTEYRKRQELK